MQELDTIIAAASSRVAQVYFRLPIYGSDPVSRERVYCYELYHQMRRDWPDGCLYVLTGEVDKRNHAAMGALGVNLEKPDFLIHNPGNMDDNHAIIEVKPAHAEPREIRKDLETLTLFRQGPEYDRAIQLFYGYAEPDELMARVHAAAAHVPDSAGIQIWHHAEVGDLAERIATL